MIDPADLRAAANILDRHPSEVYMLNTHCREAADEIERLRTALQECERLASRSGPPNEIDACNEIEQVARAALTGKP